MEEKRLQDAIALHKHAISRYNTRRNTFKYTTAGFYDRFPIVVYDKPIPDVPLQRFIEENEVVGALLAVFYTKMHIDTVRRVLFSE